jgi:hypothetical protein
MSASSTLDYFGNLNVSLQEPGVLSTDKYGISSCTAKWRTPVDGWTNLPRINSNHPIFSTLTAIHRNISINGPWAYADIEYEGRDPLEGNASSTPIYELSRALNEDPISTHPDFVSKIGGTPTHPLNGAVFEWPANPGWGKTDGVTPAHSDVGAVFVQFTLIGPDGKKNPYAKLETYLNPSKATWRKTWVATSKPTTNDGGKLQTPPGNPPSINGGVWLNMGITVTQRGSVFMCSEEWMGSGPNQIPPALY